MGTDFTPVPDTRAVGTGNPPQDINNIADELTAMGGTLNVLNANFAGGADPTGTADSAPAIQGALNAAAPGQAVLLPSAYWTGSAWALAVYKTLSLLTVPTGVVMSSWPLTRTMAIPTGNYGIGGIPLQGPIIRPTGGPLTAAIQFASNASTQYGNQALFGITIDCSNISSGTGHGILADAVGGVTLLFVTVVSAINDGLHASPVAGTGNHPPDFWQVTSCKFSNCGGWGAFLNGLADSFFTDCEATGNNGGGGWSVTNCANTRFTACKGEQSNSGAGWSFTANSGFSGQVHLVACTSQNDFLDGYVITGSAAPNAVYKLVDCASSADGQNGGSGGGGYAGLRVNNFAGTVLAPGFVSTPGSVPSPQYGVSATSSGNVMVGLTSAGGATQAVHDGGGNSNFQVRSLAAEQFMTASQMGLVAWNYPSYLAMGGTAAATSGNVCLIRVSLPGGTTTITNVLLGVQTAGSTLTSSENFAGVYDNTGAKIGGTADQTSAWGSTGLKTMALSGGPFTTSAPFVYVVFVSNGTTPPAFARLGGGTLVNSLSTLSSSGSAMPFAINGTGTALPSSLTYSSNSATGAQPFWAGLS